MDYSRMLICSWMKTWNINFESEVKERSLAQKLVGPNLASEMVAFIYTGEEGIRKAPMAYVPDLVARLQKSLNHSLHTLPVTQTW